MRFSKGFLVLLTMAMFLLSLVLPAVLGTEGPTTKVRQGNWARYIGSPPYEEYAWILVSILKVEGTTVEMSMTFDLRPRFTLGGDYYFPEHPHFMTIDVASGVSNMFMFFIPVNLTMGQRIPVPAKYPDMMIDGNEVREYCGLARTVVYASYVNTSARQTSLGGDGRLYWDKESGLLVEVVATIDGISVSSLKLTETNVWSMSLVEWLAANYLFTALVVICVTLPLSALVIFTKRAKKEFQKVSRPNMGRVLMGVGILSFIIGILNLTAFNQVVSSSGFVLAPIFFVSGMLIYSGAWATSVGNKVVIDVGTLLIALSVVLFGMIAACAMYREIGAWVPYTETESPHPLPSSMAITVIEGVFLYPYAWLVAPLATILVCLAASGLFYKALYRF